MKFLMQFFNFYIFGSLHVSVAAFCFTKITLLEYGVQENSTPLFVLFSSIVAYNFIRYYRVFEVDITFVKWVNRSDKRLLILNLISLIFVIGLAFKLRINAVLLLIPFMLLTFFYVIPFDFKGRNLRTVAGLKILVIVFSWAGITVLFPLIQNNITFSTNVAIIYLQRFLFLIAVLIPFDIRDSEFDKADLKTLPQMIGIRNSKLVGLIALIGFLMLDFIKLSAFENSIVLSAVISLISVIFLLSASVNQKKYYSSFWVEAIPVFWCALILVFGK